MTPAVNDFAFNVSIDSTGECIVVTARKDDHEGGRTEVFRLTPDVAGELSQLLTDSIRTAKDRRKAIRRAAKPSPDSANSSAQN